MLCQRAKIQRKNGYREVSRNPWNELEKKKGSGFYVKIVK